jgi:hypothetical protein
LAIALFAAKDWNSITGLFPRVIGFPMLALVVAILMIDIVKARRQSNNKQADADTAFRKSSKQAAILVSWLVGFVVLIWLIGILPTVPIYVFSYMKVQGKYSWLKSVVYAVIALAFMIILFDLIFQVAWPQGMIWQWLSL